jgi:hypothetical protein
VSTRFMPVGSGGVGGVVVVFGVLGSVVRVRRLERAIGETNAFRPMGNGLARMALGPGKANYHGAHLRFL